MDVLSITEKGDATSIGIVTRFAWFTKEMVVGSIGNDMHIIDIQVLEIKLVFQKGKVGVLLLNFGLYENKIVC